MEAVGTVSEGSIPTSVYREAPVTAPSQPPKSGGGASQKEEAAVGKKPNPIPGQPLTLKEKILWTLALVAWVLMILIT